MRALLAVLVIAMIAKDVLPIGDVYIMRGITQSLSLAAGAAVIFFGFKVNYFMRNWLVFLYVLVLGISITAADYKQYSTLQVLSLCGPILLFIGTNRGSNFTIAKNSKLVFNTLTIVYTLTCIVSIAIWLYNPTLMQEVLWGNEIRFKGLFNSPGMMGTAAGLLLGLCLVRRMSLPLRLICVAAALVCLYLTLSRTFVIAAAIGVVITRWFYYPKQRAWLVATVAAGAIGMVALMATIHANSDKEKEVDKIVRTDSLSSLSGRTSLWQRVLEARLESGLAGEGFSMGGLLLQRRDGGLIDEAAFMDPRLIGRTTLHSGYIQALADLGWIGAFIYTANILGAILFIFFKDKGRQFPVEFFIAIYLAISNGGESIIYTASNFPTILFWYACIFANNFNNTNPVKSRAQAKVRLSPTAVAQPQ